ncbi:MAG: hypothetical protein PGN15_12085 [Aeromicrobium erythreum]
MIPRPAPLQRAVLALVTASALLLGILAGTAPAQAATTVVTGTITSFDGHPVSTGVELYVNIAEPGQTPLWSSTQQVFSDENGVYRFDEGLDATQYRIGVAPQSLSSYDEETGETTFTNLAPVFHPAARTVESATTVKVPAGRTTTVNITSPEGGVVSGTVTGQPDLRHDNLAVIAQYRDPATGTWGTAGFAPVFEEDHAYNLVLQPGSYKLRFYDGNGYHYTEYWDDAATRDAGQDVTVTAGGTLSGVDAELARAGRIEGRLTLANGAPVDTDNSFTTIERRDPATGTWSQVDDVDGGYLDAEGRFGFGPLVAGTYRVKAVSNEYPRHLLRRRHRRYPDHGRDQPGRHRHRPQPHQARLGLRCRAAADRQGRSRRDRRRLREGGVRHLDPGRRVVDRQPRRLRHRRGPGRHLRRAGLPGQPGVRAPGLPRQDLARRGARRSRSRTARVPDCRP